MALEGTVVFGVTVRDAHGIVGSVPERNYRITPALTERDVVSLAAGANTITVPLGAQGVAIDLNGATEITLKGVSGDTGIALSPSAAVPRLPLFLPLSGVTSFVLTNGESTAQTVYLTYL